MFDLFSWSHILILLVVALIVVGPKDLPRLMHMIGKWVAKARAMANEFRRSFDEMARQAELDELRKEIEDLKKNNPVTQMANQVSEAQGEVNRSVAASPPSPQAELAVSQGQAEPRAGELKVTEHHASAQEPSVP